MHRSRPVRGAGDMFVVVICGFAGRELVYSLSDFYREADIGRYLGMRVSVLGGEVRHTNVP